VQERPGLVVVRPGPTAVQEVLAADDRLRHAAPMTTAAPARLAMVTLDCAEPRAEAAFWSAALGWEVAHVQDEYAMLTGGGSALGFGRVEGYAPPSWPDDAGVKQFHFDLAVDDLTAAEQALVALGATVPDAQPGGERWRVLLDPAGHPFCLTLAANWG
jgi:catechol 2,3-dioxygenase-like lactoylglutathione lyase family enzyme